MSERSHPSFPEIVAGVILIPPLVYGSGYLLWIGPSRILYGRDLTSDLHIAAFLEPGIYYASALLLSVVLAVMLGPTRLSHFQKKAPRPTLLFFECVLWLVIISAATVLASGRAGGNPPGRFPPKWCELPFTFVHVAVVALSFTRLYGLIRSRYVQPPEDHRRFSSKGRVMRSVLVVLMVFAQVPLAILFGIYGPNPAKWPRTAVVLETQGPGSVDTRDVLLIEHGQRYLTAFDTKSRIVVEIPDERIVRIDLHPHGE